MPRSVRVLVFGASGDQGRAQVRTLAASGFRVLAASRHHTLPGLDDLPTVTAIHADYDDPASLERACREADAAFLTMPSSSFQDSATLLRYVGHVAEAAAAVQIRLLVFNTSMLVRDAPLGFAAHDTRLAMKQRLRASGVPLVIVKPVIYMDNLLRGWARPSITQQGILSYPHAPELEVSWICQSDVARLMIAALERPQLAGREFTVGGPEALRGEQTAERLSRAIGQEIRFESRPIAEFCADMANVLQTTATVERSRLIEALAGIYRWYNESPECPFKVDMAPVLQHLPVELTPLERWARAQNWESP